VVRGTPVRFPSSQDIPAGSPIRFSLSRDSDTRVDRQMSSASKANRFDFGDYGPLNRTNGAGRFWASVQGTESRVSAANVYCAKEKAWDQAGHDRDQALWYLRATTGNTG